mgnify:CR=1 FL=1
MGKGRPLRALAGLGVMLVAWLGWRAPQLAGEARQLAAGLAPPVMLAQAPAPDTALQPSTMREQSISLPPPPRLALVRWQPPLFMHPERYGSPLRAADGSPPVDRPEAAPVAPATPVLASEPPSRAFNLADQAYQRLRAGDRRQAAALFDAALALEPGNRQWQADRRALGRRWQLGWFSLLRDGGPAPNAPGSGLPGATTSPVLGGGQQGASLAYVLNPLARRPLAIVARANVAADASGIQAETAQAAIGLRQTLLPGVTLSAERLIALGEGTRSDWTLRLAAGATRGRLEAYGEAGVLGSGQIYGGAQATARMLQLGPATLAAGAWGSGQTAPSPAVPDVWRVDVGPAVSTRWKKLRVQADWRQRVAGNAAPGSGPVLTVAADF